MSVVNDCHNAAYCSLYAFIALGDCTPCKHFVDLCTATFTNYGLYLIKKICFTVF